MIVKEADELYKKECKKQALRLEVSGLSSGRRITLEVTHLASSGVTLVRCNGLELRALDGPKMDALASAAGTMVADAVCTYFGPGKDFGTLMVKYDEKVIFNASWNSAQALQEMVARNIKLADFMA